MFKIERVEYVTTHALLGQKNMLGLAHCNPTKFPHCSDNCFAEPLSQCGGVEIAHDMRRSQLSTGAQTTDYRRVYSVSVPCIYFLTLCIRR